MAFTVRVVKLVTRWISILAARVRLPPGVTNKKWTILVSLKNDWKVKRCTSKMLKKDNACDPKYPVALPHTVPCFWNKHKEVPHQGPKANAPGA